MPIHPSMHAALKALTAFDIDVKKTYKLERRLQKTLAELRGKPSDFIILDKEILCGEHNVPVRMFFPQNGLTENVLLFFHGGGWVTGGIENYTRVCADLAKATHSTVASVDYRLAPEHRFPAAPEDCYAVAKEFFMGRVLKILPEHITLMGDSAGGNLAAVVSLMARDRGEFRVSRQILLYPSTYNDHSEASPFASIRENGTDYLLTSKRIQRVIELYCSSPEDLQNPYFAPLIAEDLSGQPRTLVITAEFCPLRDEGECYGQKLRRAGNEVRIVRMRDALHAYFMLPPRHAAVRKTYKLINAFLAAAKITEEPIQNER